MLPGLYTAQCFSRYKVVCHPLKSKENVTLKRTVILILTFSLMWIVLDLPYCWSYKVRHEETDLKVFVIVIPKEALVGWEPANTSLGMTTTTEYNL